MNKFNSSLVIVFCLLTLLSSRAQENALLDRNFWKSKPSIDDIQIKIGKGHSPTEFNSNSFDPTTFAIFEDAPIETVEFMLAQGNDVNKITHDGRTYIFWAAYRSNLPLMKYLLGKGAKLDILDQHGYSVMMYAAVNGVDEPAIYDYLIENGMKIQNEKDRDGRNALLAYAGSTKTGKLFEYFVDKGLKMSSVDNNGNGIFNHTARTGNKELMERLMKEYKVSTEKNTNTNENAILFASRRSSRSGDEMSMDFINYLVGLGLDPLIVSTTGNTALHNISSRSDSKELYSYFLDRGADVNQRDENGNTPLINASAGRSLEIVTLLADKTSDINFQNKEGMSAFSRALISNKLEVAKYLAAKGAETNIFDKQGNDLGYHLVSAFSGNMALFSEKMNYLISLGYDPKVAQKGGATLLHTAISKGNEELIGSLLDFGIDINAKDDNGQTALHLAAMQAKDSQLLRYLIGKGANKLLTTEFEESAYDLAKANELLSERAENLEFLKTGEGK